TKWREEVDRPWGDLKAEKRGDSLLYVELPLTQWIEEDAEGRRKARKNKKNGQGKGVDGRVVPGAAA
nr:hypothetical protein [Tanacetum cinerariifolium]